MEKGAGLSLAEAGLVDEGVVGASEVRCENALLRNGHHAVSFGHGEVAKLNVAGRVATDDVVAWLQWNGGAISSLKMRFAG